MSSIIKVDQIQLADGSTPTAADLGLNTTGSVLQVVQNTYSTKADLASDSWTDTGFSASITPSSASNKILIIVTTPIYWHGNGMSMRLLRGTTPIFTPTVNYTYHFSTTGNSRAVYTIQYLDSPDSTTAVTYKTQGIGHATTTADTSADSNISVMTFMEIAG